MSRVIAANQLTGRLLSDSGRIQPGRLSDIGLIFTVRIPNIQQPAVELSQIAAIVKDGYSFGSPSISLLSGSGAAFRQGR